MNKDYFIELGGLDVEHYEYMDKPIHDFMFRLQRDGGEIHFSPTHVCVATHLPETTGDHGPVHHAYHRDIPHFNMTYSVPELYEKRIKIDFDNYKKSPVVWKRRFVDKIPKSYDELCQQRGYNIEDIKSMKARLDKLLEEQK